MIAARLPRHNIHGGIDLLVTFPGKPESPFGAYPNDPEPYGREIYSRALAGEFGAVAEYQETPLSIGEIATAKLAAIQAEKCRVRDGGVVVDGVLFDTDQAAMGVYTKTMVFLFAQQPEATIPAWKASYGCWVEMNLPLLSSLIPTMAANEMAAFAWQAGVEAEIAAAVAAGDIEALQNVSINYQARP